MNTQFFANYGANFNDLITQFNGLDKNYACPFLALEKLTGKKVHERDVENFQYDFLHELSGENIKLKNKVYIENTKDIFLPLSINLSKTYKAKNAIKNKGFLSLKNIVGNDKLRPISQGVFLTNGDLVATDAHKLVILTGQNTFETLSDISDIHMSTLMKFKGLYDAKNETDSFINNLNLDLDKKLINFYTGQLMQEKYFNYPAIIPNYKQEYENRYECSVETMLFKIEKAMNHAANFSKNQKNLVFGFDKKNNKTTAVNIKLLSDTIYCLAANCTGNMTFYVSNENNRALCIETDNGHFALVMPMVRNNNDGSDAHIFVGGVHTYSV